MKLDLFEPEGWLNVPEILKQPGIDFFVMLGARQVGKTYGCLKELLQKGEKFIYMRRTNSEFEVCATNPELNPFKKNDPSIYLQKADKYTYSILKPTTEEGEPQLLGVALALTSVAKIRGFSADEYTTLLYDEFIPERHVNKIKDEGDALLNVYVTINGNRELEGRPALRMILLANSNDLSNNVLETLNLTDKIDRMSERGQLYARIDNLFLLVLKDSPISEKRKKTALYRFIGQDSEFYKMSIDNEFAYNDRSNVYSSNYKAYTPVVRLENKNGNVVFTVGEDGNGHYYVYAMKPACRDVIQDTETGRKLFATLYRSLWWVYISGAMHFQSYRIKNAFLKIYNS